MNNVPNGHPRTANICNNITCIDVIGALENSSIIYIYIYIYIYTNMQSVNYDRVQHYFAQISVTEPFEMFLKLRYVRHVVLSVRK